MNNEWRLKFSDYPQMNLVFSDSSQMNLKFGTEIKPVIGNPASDYSELSNKPSINGVTLVGNKTNEELNITSLSNSEIEELLKSFV